MKNKCYWAAACLMALSLPLHADPGDTLSLDEKWLFKLAKTESTAPRDYAAPHCDDSQWGFQKMPGTWRVPVAWAESNYVGTYRGWLKMPPTLKNRRIFLHLGFTTATADIYVNGQKIGRSATDRAQTEFEVTPYIKLGQRNLFVFHMPHYDEGDTPLSPDDKTGILSRSFVYNMPADASPAPEQVPAPASPGTRVGDRRNLALSRGFDDTPQRMLSDIERLRQLGFGAITYNKLSSSPEFLALARQHNMPVVSTPPVTSERLVDENNAYTPAAYDLLLPAPDFDFTKALADKRRLAGEALPHPRPRKKKTDDWFTVRDKTYHIVFDRFTGLIHSYTLNDVAVFSARVTVMPNARFKLVSFKNTRPHKLRGTRVTAVYDVEGQGRVTWVYDIAPSGVLTLTAGGGSDILVSLSPRFEQPQVLAQGFTGTDTLTTLPDRRPRAYLVRGTEANGHGIEVMGPRPFTALKAPATTQVIVHHDAKDFELSFLPLTL
ncbi:hypothetical protein [Hallella seregens]|uniref:hypothetical protein n=1 Tax=Hallella seregens TaxID=52229 RepID=UPI0004835883|nr:hypothetical protein [Hallella seregens]